MRIKTLFGEHVIECRSRSKTAVNLIKEQYKTFICKTSNTVDLHIYIEDEFGIPFENYEVAIKEKENKILFTRADYSVVVDDTYRNAEVRFHDELALKHALMNLYSCFIVHHNWGLLIHSSCVLDSGAHLFCGPSGAGKSTIARLSLPRVLLSDEASIVKINRGVITVFDSPFRSEIQSDKFTVPSNLKSIQLLKQSKSNRRVPISKSFAYIELIDKIFYWSYKSSETERVLKLLKQLVKDVEVFDLFFQKNNAFWELITNDKVYS